LEFSPIPMALAKNNGDLILLNKQFVETYGYTLHELGSIQKWFEIVYPDMEYRNLVLQDWSNNVEFALKNNIPTPVKEYSVTCKNGDIKTVEISAFFEKDYSIGLFQDITERKRTHEELIRTSEMLHKTGELAKVGGWELDLVTNKMYFSKEALLINEAEPDEDFTLNLAFERIDSEYLHLFEVAVSEAIEHGISYDIDAPIITAKGKKIWTRTQGSAVIENGKAVKLYGAFQDITERKIAENALKESEEKFREIVEMIGEGVGFVDNNEFFIFTNTTAEKIFEVAQGELIGKNLSVFLPAEEIEKISTQSHYRKQGLHTSYDLEIITPKGNSKLIIVTATPRFDNDNNFIGTYGVFRDITERKQAEIQLQQYATDLKKLNTDKDRFIKILAHDLKNPFSTLLGFSDLLVKNINKYDKEKIEKQLRIIHQTAHKTYHLLEDILQWTNSQSGNLAYKPQLINLNEICNEQIEHIKNHAETKQIALKYLETDNIQVYADVNMLKTILRNLILNAVKFTHPNGQIKVYAKKNDNYAIVTVSDNGIGIDQENISKLWNITSRLSTNGTNGETGTGFGLLLCMEFVEKHGGKIWVESEVGKGSDFKFLLPLFIH